MAYKSPLIETLRFGIKRNFAPLFCEKGAKKRCRKERKTIHFLHINEGCQEPTGFVSSMPRASKKQKGKGVSTSRSSVGVRHPNHVSWVVEANAVAEEDPGVVPAGDRMLDWVDEIVQRPA
ncbi:hypothetical protein QYF36_005153 [Acer negundo]|nr:hypothetical protein QYF36_005153 [Acer negundo]